MRQNRILYERVYRENFQNPRIGVLFSNEMMTVLVYAHSRALTRLTHVMETVNVMDNMYYNSRDVGSIFQEVWNMGIRTNEKKFHPSFPKRKVIFVKLGWFGKRANIEVVVLVSLKSHYCNNPFIKIHNLME